MKQWKAAQCELIQIELTFEWWERWELYFSFSEIWVKTRVIFRLPGDCCRLRSPQLSAENGRRNGSFGSWTGCWYTRGRSKCHQFVLVSGNHRFQTLQFGLIKPVKTVNNFEDSMVFECCGSYFPLHNQPWHLSKFSGHLISKTKSWATLWDFVDMFTKQWCRLRLHFFHLLRKFNATVFSKPWLERSMAMWISECLQLILRQQRTSAFSCGIVVAERATGYGGSTPWSKCCLDPWAGGKYCCYSLRNHARPGPPRSFFPSISFGQENPNSEWRLSSGRRSLSGVASSKRSWKRRRGEILPLPTSSSVFDDQFVDPSFHGSILYLFLRKVKGTRRKRTWAFLPWRRSTSGGIAPPRFRRSMNSFNYQGWKRWGPTAVGKQKPALRFCIFLPLLVWPGPWSPWGFWATRVAAVSGATPISRPQNGKRPFGFSNGAETAAFRINSEPCRGCML